LVTIVFPKRDVYMDVVTISLATHPRLQRQLHRFACWSFFIATGKSRDKVKFSSLLGFCLVGPRKGNNLYGARRKLEAI